MTLPLAPALSVSALLLATLLAACGDHATHAEGDHAGHDMADVVDPATPANTDPVVTIATGRFISVVPEGTYATLDHDPIPAINMGAMQMGFDIDPALDLTRYSEGDDLRFRLVTSEATGFLITAICRPATDGEDCL